MFVIRRNNMNICTKCGRGFEGNVCSNCGMMYNVQPQIQYQQPVNINNNNFGEKKKFNGKKMGVLIVVILLVLGVGIDIFVDSMNNKKEDERREEMRDVGAEILEHYRNKEFDKAIKVAEELEEPYSDYYIDFINYAKEVSEWEGTGEELYLWLEDFFEFYQESEYADAEIAKYVIGFFWQDVASAKEEFDSYKDKMKDAFSWTEEYNEIAEDIYVEYCEIVYENRELFGAKAMNNKVNISKSDIEYLDEKLDEWHENSIEEIEKFEESHKGFKPFDEYLALEKEDIDKLKEIYYEDFSAGVICSEYKNDEDYFYLTSNEAKKIYKWDGNRAIIGYKLVSANDIGHNLVISTDKRHADMPEDACYYGIADYEICRDVLEIFEFVCPTIKGGERIISVDDIYNEMFDK